MRLSRFFTKPPWILLIGMLGTLSLLAQHDQDVHPDQAGLPLAPLAALGTLVIVLLIFLAAHVVGRVVLSLCRVRCVNRTEYLAFTVAVGAIPLSLLQFVLAAMGWLTPPASVLCTIALAVCALAYNVRHTANLATPISSTPAPRDVVATLAVVGLLGLGVAIIAASMIVALAPPIDRDSLAYHIATPDLYLRAHSMIPISFAAQNDMPLGTEMLDLLGLSAADQSVPATLSSGFALLTMLLFIGSSPRWGRRRTGLIAAAIYPLTPLAALAAAWAGIDVALAFDVLAATLACLIGLQHREQPGWLVIAGLLLGMAISTKYTGAEAVVVLVPLVALVSRRKNWPWRQTVLAILAVGVPALVVPLPWLIRNFLWFGNPFYPYGGHFFTTTLTTTPSTQIAGTAGTGRALQDYLLLPIRLVTQPRLYFSNSVLPFNVFCLALPAALLSTPPRRQAAIMAVVALAGWGIWVLGPQDIRYYLPFSVLLLPLAAHGVEGLLTMRWFVPRIVMTLSILLVQIWMLTFQIGLLRHFQNESPSQDFSAWAVLRGAESPARYLSQHLIAPRLVAYINAHLPLTSTLLMWGDPEGLYIRRAYIADTVQDGAFYTWMLQYPTPAAFDQAVQRQHITHILTFRYDLLPDPIGTTLNLSVQHRAVATYLQLRSCCMRLIAQDQQYQLYGVR